MDALIRDDENHDQRYEDGDYSTGTVEDYDGDWLSEDGEWRADNRTAEERAQGVGGPPLYIGRRPRIEVPHV